MSLTDGQRSALRILASSLRGQSVSTMMAHGFTYEALQDLVRAGFASAGRDAIGAAKTRSAHLRITEAGRKAITE
jgi:pyrroline-5-carboxylate reductase